MHGDTTLIHAARTGKLNSVEKLLKFGANANILGYNGQTALVNALADDHEDCTETLIDSGASVNIADDNGMTPLMHTTSGGRLSVINKLIEAGAEIDKVSKEGFTAIFYATWKGNAEALRKLVEAGADVNNDKDEITRTPLMEAAMGGHVNCVEELIKAGVDLNIRNKYINLVHRSFIKCTSTLVKAGADVDTEYLAIVANRLTKGNFAYHNQESVSVRVFINKKYWYSVFISNNSPILLLHLLLRDTLTPHLQQSERSSWENTLDQVLPFL